MSKVTRSVSSTQKITEKLNANASKSKRLPDLSPDEKPKKKGKVSKSASSSSLILRIKTEKFIGAHVSIAGGVHKSVLEANEIGANAFALFLKSNHQWKGKALDAKDVVLFKENCVKYNFPPEKIVPHTCYLLNLAAPKEEILEKSREAFVEELQRCETLGLTLLNTHPGSTCGTISKEEGIRRCAESINLALEATKGVTVLVENMCGQGNTLGGDFNELKDIIAQVTDKQRIGMCLDTCHAFAYGYNLTADSGFKNMMGDLESIIGIKYLKAVHLNDSNGAVGSHLDRHANIGKGKIGIAGFKRLLNDARFNNIPMILETPLKEAKSYKDEIALLNKLCH